MKTKSLIVIAVSLVFIGAVHAEKETKAGSGQRYSPEVIGKFDKDGDGKLNKEEAAAERSSRIGKKGGGKRAEMLRKFDKDGDGELNEEEQVAARVEKRKQMVEQFDEDKNGKLDEDEKAKMNAEIKKRHDAHKKVAEENKAGEAGKKEGSRNAE